MATCLIAGVVLGAVVFVVRGFARKHDWAELMGDAVFGTALGALVGIAVGLGAWYLFPCDVPTP